MKMVNVIGSPPNNRWRSLVYRADVVKTIFFLLSVASSVQWKTLSIHANGVRFRKNRDVVYAHVIMCEGSYAFERAIQGFPSFVKR